MFFIEIFIVKFRKALAMQFLGIAINYFPSTMVQPQDGGVKVAMVGCCCSGGRV